MSRGAAIGLAALLGGWRAWVVAPLAAGIVYVLVQSLELVVGIVRTTAERQAEPAGFVGGTSSGSA